MDFADGEIDIDQIRFELAQAHINAVGADNSGIHGLLHPEEIAEYHHAVFKKFNLPKNAFGGTPFTGKVFEANLTRGIWCRGCDTE